MERYKQTTNPTGSKNNSLSSENDSSRDQSKAALDSIPMPTLGDLLLRSTAVYQKQTRTTSSSSPTKEAAAEGGAAEVVAGAEADHRMAPDIVHLRDFYHATGGLEWLSERRVRTNLILWEADQQAKVEVRNDRSFIHSFVRSFVRSFTHSFHHPSSFQSKQ